MIDRNNWFIDQNHLLTQIPSFETSTAIDLSIAVVTNYWFAALNEKDWFFFLKYLSRACPWTDRDCLPITFNLQLMSTSFRFKSLFCIYDLTAEIFFGIEWLVGFLIPSPPSLSISLPFSIGRRTSVWQHFSVWMTRNFNVNGERGRLP